LRPNGQTHLRRRRQVQCIVRPMVDCLLFSKALDVATPLTFTGLDHFVCRYNRKEGAIGKECDLTTWVVQLAPCKVCAATKETFAQRPNAKAHLRHRLTKPPEYEQDMAAVASGAAHCWAVRLLSRELVEIYMRVHLARRLPFHLILLFEYALLDAPEAMAGAKSYIPSSGNEFRPSLFSRRSQHQLHVRIIFDWVVLKRVYPSPWLVLSFVTHFLPPVTHLPTPCGPTAALTGAPAHALPSKRGSVCVLCSAMLGRCGVPWPVRASAR